MKKLLPALLAILLLTACAQSSVETSNKVATENQTVDNFERNLECQKLKKEAEDFWNDKKNNFLVESIFYSPQRDSCVYVLNFYHQDYGLEWWIYDFFTNQELENFRTGTKIYTINEKIE